MIIAKRLSLAVLASALVSTAAIAGDSAWTDHNCMFRSGVAQKGGEATRTSVYNSDSTAKYQWCSPTTRGERHTDYTDQTYRDRHVRGYNAGEYPNTAPAMGY